MTKNLRDVIRVSDRTVIPLGGLGCFDEHGIFPMNVLRDGDAVLRLHLRLEPPRVGIGGNRHRAGDQPGRRPHLPAHRRRARCWRRRCTSPAWSATGS